MYLLSLLRLFASPSVSMIQPKKKIHDRLSTWHPQGRAPEAKGAKNSNRCPHGFQAPSTSLLFPKSTLPHTLPPSSSVSVFCTPSLAFTHIVRGRSIPLHAPPGAGALRAPLRSRRPSREEQKTEARMHGWVIVEARRQQRELPSPLAPPTSPGLKRSMTLPICRMMDSNCEAVPTPTPTPLRQ
ncbi:hypothetical protein B0T10DRAFT_221851 [Thelonectria olida]|uniref:Uncharacterized protein n=1 Tax=Thelonectria olida TaxID=1576542 RepID=A0A9P9AWB6_9HYPO|nr:hypothetical protein B0T10DRAFT_221851 [Thelonectria olida]